MEWHKLGISVLIMALLWVTTGETARPATSVISPCRVHADTQPLGAAQVNEFPLEEVADNVPGPSRIPHLYAQVRTLSPDDMTGEKRRRSPKQALSASSPTVRRGPGSRPTADEKKAREEAARKALEERRKADVDRLQKRINDIKSRRAREQESRIGTIKPPKPGGQFVTVGAQGNLGLQGTINVELRSGDFHPAVRDEFVVNVLLHNPRGLPVEEFGLWVTYNPEVFEVIDEQPKVEGINILPARGVIDSIIHNAAYPELGQLLYRFTGGKDDPLYLNGSVGQITFRCLAPTTGVETIRGHFGEWGFWPNTYVIYEGRDMLSSETNHKDGIIFSSIQVRAAETM